MYSTLLINNVLADVFFYKWKNSMASYTHIENRFHSLSDHVSFFNPDVLLLQEFSRQELFPRFIDESKWDVYHNCKSGRSPGQAVLLNPTLWANSSVIATFRSGANGFVAVKTTSQCGKVLGFISIHGKYGDTSRLVEEHVELFISHHQDIPWIAAGDFNKEIDAVSIAGLKRVPIDSPTHLSNTEHGNFIVTYDHVFVSPCLYDSLEKSMCLVQTFCCAMEIIVCTKHTT
ncbi:hypothetical protein GEMRC1_007075 [Eukaryota sp. GEM-RC1]